MNQGPQLPPAYFEGMTLLKQGQLLEAKNKLDEALSGAPQAIEIHNALGLLGYRSGNPDMAVFYFKNCVKLAPLDPGHRQNFISLSQSIKQDHAAFSFLSEIVRHYPGDEGLVSDFVKLAHSAREYSRAITVLKAFLNRHPDHINLTNNLCLTYFKAGEFEEAERQFEQCIAAHPDVLSFRANFGFFLNELGRFQEAEEQYKQALERKTDDIGLTNGLSNVLVAQQKFNEAQKLNIDLLHLYPNSAETHTHLAFCQLATSDFAQGWAEYEWRWKSESFSKDQQITPVWDGTNPKDKHILVYYEQGLGDTLQFIRFAQNLEDLGAKVSACVQPALKSLVTNMCIFEKVASRLTEFDDVDFYIPTMSLPYKLQLNSEEQLGCASPYIKTDKDIAPNLAKELSQSTKPKIGVCWKGNKDHSRDQFRSIPYGVFSRLFDIPELTFVNLQIDRNPENEILPNHVIDATSFIQDFEDTAAIAAQLDAIVTVDTSISHLCGAAHYPTWLLLSSVIDWRWMTKRTDSPWYPTLKITRNETPNDWSDVISILGKELVTNFCDTQVK